jgi:hypothetical protein
VTRRSNESVARLGYVAAAVLSCVAALALSGCSSSGTPSATTSTPTGGGSASTTKPVVPHVLVATFADNGGTLTVQVNNRIRMVLAGTSWTQSSSNPSVVVVTGKAKTRPASSGCVPDQGCGSVTVFYRALKTGTAQILGARGSCQGAGSTCKTGEGAFKLNIVVTKGAH